MTLSCSCPEAFETAYQLGKKKCRFVFVCPQCGIGTNHLDETQSGIRFCGNVGCGYVEGEKPEPCVSCTFSEGASNPDRSRFIPIIQPRREES